METKQIKIEVPEGFEINKDKSTFELIVFKEVPKKPVRTTKWEDFDRVDGYYVTYFSEVFSYKDIEGHPKEKNKNIWPTKELAEASLALCQLIRYRDNWNEGWVPIWNDNKANLVNYCIVPVGTKIKLQCYDHTRATLAFKTESLALDFLETFKDLLEIAKPLL